VSPLYSADFAKLQLTPPPGLSVQRWLQAVDGAGRFLDALGREAQALGWTADDLFSPTGLILTLNGAHVTALTSPRSRLRMPSSPMGARSPATHIIANGGTVMDDRKILIPFSNSEAITLKRAGGIAGRTTETMRGWAANKDLGRLIGGRWMISHPALLMFLDGDGAALNLYWTGDRQSETVTRYFQRANVKI
jgi:hypothetical protein